LRALSRVREGCPEGIVKLFGVGKDPREEFVFVVLEQCEGDGWGYVNRIYAKCETFPKDLIEAWHTLALGCAHITACGILHRDLTLDNILFVTSPKLAFKVSDFGISGTAADYRDIPRGKMRNYPPEAIGENCSEYVHTEKSDVFMFGLIIWETLH
jgi:serine/threonine protein kinase